MRRARHHSKRRRIFHAALVALVFCALGCATPTPAPPASQEVAKEQTPSPPKLLTEIRVGEEGGFLDVTFIGSESMRYTAFKAIDPLRLVVDLPDTLPGAVSSPLAVENEIIGKIQTMVVSQEPKPMTRVEIGLNRETPYEIAQDQGGIRVRFEKPALVSQAAPAETQPKVEPQVQTPSAETTAPQKAAAPQPPMQETVAPSAAVAKETLARATTVVAIQPVTVDQTLKVDVITDGKLPSYNAFPLTNPPRLVLDLMGIRSTLAEKSVPVNSPLVKKIRLGNFQDKVRVVFDLIPEAGIPYKLIAGDDRLVVALEPGSGFPSQPTPAVTAPSAEPEKAAAPAEPTASKQPPANIKAIDFNLLDSGKSRLTITADRPLQPDIQISGASSISVVLKDSKLPVPLQRQIDTGQFASAVNLIDPRSMAGEPNTVDIHVELREMVPYHLSPHDNQVYVDFDPSAVPPPHPIELGKPVTVAEARTPAAPLPVPEATTVTTPPPQQAAQAPAATEQAKQTAKPAVEEAVPVVVTESPLAVEEQKVYTGERISLDLQDVDVRNVLRLLADVTSKNLVVEPNVSGKVTLKVDKVPWDQVLDLILKINELDKVVEGNVIRIAKATKIQAERDSRVAAIEAKKKAQIAAEGLDQVVTEYLQVNYADAENIKNQIDKIKTERGSTTVDKRTNLIIYRDIPRQIATAKQILKELDRPTPQVMIEARIVEASTNFSRDLGIQWGGSYTPGRLTDNLGGTATIQGLLGGSNFAVDAPVGAVGSIGLTFARTAGFTMLNLDLRLTALESAGESKLISSPRIFTLDNVQASIQQGENIPYPQQSQDGISTAFVSATLSLTVTPHITPDNKVRLEVSAKNDFADFSRTVNGSPAINTREAKTELLVNNGDTIVIGGIITENRSWGESRVPFLGRLPLLGWLFKSRSVADTKGELLIFLSPTIVNS
jgi:type IV pilus assembly protein PilQ